MDSFRTSQQDKNSLIALKRRTGIEQWNIICRWAFCLSAREESLPREDKIDAQGVEMEWSTFAGENSDIYLEILKGLCQRHDVEPTDANMLRIFRLHLHRGIQYMVGTSSLNSIVGLIELAVPRI